MLVSRGFGEGFGDSPLQSHVLIMLDLFKSVAGRLILLLVSERKKFMRRHMAVMCATFIHFGPILATMF